MLGYKSNQQRSAKRCKATGRHQNILFFFSHKNVKCSRYNSAGTFRNFLFTGRPPNLCPPLMYHYPWLLSIVMLLQLLLGLFFFLLSAHSPWHKELSKFVAMNQKVFVTMKYFQWPWVWRQWREACQNPDNLNWIASSLVRVPYPWSGEGHGFESPAGLN